MNGKTFPSPDPDNLPDILNSSSSSLDIVQSDTELKASSSADESGSFRSGPVRLEEKDHPNNDDSTSSSNHQLGIKLSECVISEETPEPSRSAEKDAKDEDETGGETSLLKTEPSSEGLKVSGAGTDSESAIQLKPASASTVSEERLEDDNEPKNEVRALESIKSSSESAGSNQSNETSPLETKSTNQSEPPEPEQLSNNQTRSSAQDSKIEEATHDGTTTDDSRKQGEDGISETSDPKPLPSFDEPESSFQDLESSVGGLEIVEKGSPKKSRKSEDEILPQIRNEQDQANDSDDSVQDLDLSSGALIIDEGDSEGETSSIKLQAEKSSPKPSDVSSQEKTESQVEKSNPLIESGSDIIVSEDEPTNQAPKAEPIPSINVKGGRKVAKKSFAKTTQWGARCCVDGCPVTDSVTKEDGSMWRLFEFPSDFKRRSLWISMAKPLQHTFSPCKYHKICERHFEPESLSGSVSPDSVGGPDPCLNLPDITRMNLIRAGGSQNKCATFSNSWDGGARGLQKSSPQNPQRREIKKSPESIVSRLSMDLISMQRELNGLMRAYSTGFEEKMKLKQAVEEKKKETGGVEEKASNALAQFAAAFRQANKSSSVDQPQASIDNSSSGHVCTEEIFGDPDLEDCQFCKITPEVQAKIQVLDQGAEKLEAVLKELLANCQAEPQMVQEPQKSQKTFQVARKFPKPATSKPASKTVDLVKKKSPIRTDQKPKPTSPKVVKSVPEKRKILDVQTPSEDQPREKVAKIKQTKESPSKHPSSSLNDFPMMVARSILLTHGPLITSESFFAHAPAWIARSTGSLVLEVFELLVRDGLLFGPIKFKYTEPNKNKEKVAHVYGKTDVGDLTQEELDVYNMKLREYEKAYYESMPRDLSHLTGVEFDFETLTYTLE